MHQLLLHVETVVNKCIQNILWKTFIDHIKYRIIWMNHYQAWVSTNIVSSRLFFLSDGNIRYLWFESHFTLGFIYFCYLSSLIEPLNGWFHWSTLKCNFTAAVWMLIWGHTASKTRWLIMYFYTANATDIYIKTTIWEHFWNQCCGYGATLHCIQSRTLVYYNTS